MTAGGQLLVSVRAWRLGCPGSGPTSAVTGCGTGRVTLKLPSPGPRQMSKPKQGGVKHNRFFKVIPTTVPTKHLIKSKRGQKSRPQCHSARDRPTNAGKGPNPYCSHSRHPSERGAGCHPPFRTPPGIPRQEEWRAVRLGGAEGVGAYLPASFVIAKPIILFSCIFTCRGGGGGWEVFVGGTYENEGLKPPNCPLVTISFHSMAGVFSSSRVYINYVLRIF